MDHTGPDHPVFKRFSRQQLIVRRRNIGFQALIFETTTTASNCKNCARPFNAVWKAFLCHVCGFLVCLPCSSVLERERLIGRVQFIRTCYACIGMLNKWSDPGLLTEYAQTSWVIQCSKNQLALNLADMLCKKRERRRAVLTILKHLDMQIDSFASQIDTITEAEWVNASAPDQDPLRRHSLESPEGPGSNGESSESSSGTSSKPSFEGLESAQHLIQQCYEVSIEEFPITQCHFAEEDGTRVYPLYQDLDLDAPYAPSVPDENERAACIARYDLLTRDLNLPEMQLICELALKEMEATSVMISIVEGELQHSLIGQPPCRCNAMDRSQTFCAYALATTQPFLVRDATLDIRFRNFEVVRGNDNIRSYMGFPILSDTGIVIAALCVLDTKPRKQVTTMQYTIMKCLADIVSSLWKNLVQA